MKKAAEVDFTWAAWQETLWFFRLAAPPDFAIEQVGRRLHVGRAAKQTRAIGRGRGPYRFA
jgi:hypothetical protein